MEESTLERIFDPYFTTKEVGEGSGLGLAVVQGIVKRHEGAIRVRSKPGKGTVFEIRFPRIERGREPAEDAPRGLAGGTERILFVDDEEPLAALGERMLVRLGYRVTTKTSSIEAIELFRSKPDAFDLVITDYTMPDMTGGDLAREVMRLRPGIPVILCTGYSEMVSEDAAKELGVGAFIMKPLSLRDLALVIRGIFDGKSSSP
jgi:CheY-like chemotaxis protein